MTAAVTTRIDPFVFVAATRYAIHRTLTTASELLAAQVHEHADLITADPGAASAIIREIEDWLGAVKPDALHGPDEIPALRASWARARAALADHDFANMKHSGCGADAHRARTDADGLDADAIAAWCSRVAELLRERPEVEAHAASNERLQFAFSPAACKMCEAIAAVEVQAFDETVRRTRTAAS